MKKVLTKVGYMAFGCLLTLIGYHFGNIDNNSANAQLTIFPPETEIVDEIRCRKLVIVGDDDTPGITLDTDLFDRGRIQIYNEDGKRRVFLSIASDYDTGAIEIAAENSGGTAVFLGVDHYGGFMALFNKVIDKPVVQTGITDKGEGFVLTRDKVGYQTGTVGSPGTFIFSEKYRNK